MALAAFQKWSLTLLVEVLMGIAVLDMQWVSRGFTALLGMWDRRHGSNRGADGCVEAVFSVLEKQGGEAAGDTTTRILSAYTAVQACASRASLLSSTLHTDCVQRQGLWHSSISSASCWAEARTLQCLLERVHEQHMASCYWNLLRGEQQEILMEFAIWFWK